MNPYKVRIVNIRPLRYHNEGGISYLRAEVDVEITSPQGAVTLVIPVGPPAVNLEQVAVAALQAVFEFGDGVARAAQASTAATRYGP